MITKEQYELYKKRTIINAGDRGEWYTDMVEYELHQLKMQQVNLIQWADKNNIKLPTFILKNMQEILKN